MTNSKTSGQIPQFIGPVPPWTALKPLHFRTNSTTSLIATLMFRPFMVTTLSKTTQSASLAQLMICTSLLAVVLDKIITING